jgi:8-oxo-dGTP pyrophosphatase MutT (NUDIX family)
LAAPRSVSRPYSDSSLPSTANVAEKLDLDSVAAIIYMSGRRYLLQHREDRSGISYPNAWGLFGGARETGEDAEAALRREMMEELEFPVGACSLFVGCTFDLRFEARRTRKIFFSVEMTETEVQRLVLREGQGMAWLSFGEILARADDVVPYDLGMIALHHSRLGA